MPKHHPHRPPHHHHHHVRRAGLHHIAKHLDELRKQGVPEEDLGKLLEALTNRLPNSVRPEPADGNALHGADALAAAVQSKNSEALQLLKTSSVLIAGQLPPHLIAALLEDGVVASQVHDPAPHGGDPPHFRDLVTWFPGCFSGTTSFAPLARSAIDVIVVEAFLGHQGTVLVSPLAVMAQRLWPAARPVAIPSDHLAPHHLLELEPAPTLFLFWE